jgi:hypothetical protein
MDDLIKSIVRIYFLTLSLAIIYLFVCSTQISRNYEVEKLGAVDALAAISYIANLGNSFEKYGEATTDVLTRFFPSALRAAIDQNLNRMKHAVDKAAEEEEYEDDYQPEYEEGIDDVFSSDIKVENVRVVPDIPMRMSPGGSCDALVSPLSPGISFNLASFQVVSGYFNVKSENMRMISFGNCMSGVSPREFNFVIAHLPDQGAILILPDLMEKFFPEMNQSSGFRSFTLDRPKEIKDLLPSKVRVYANFDGKLIVLHIKALRHYVLQYASQKSGKYSSAADFDLVVDNLYRDGEPSASFLGINTGARQIIRYAPLVFMVLFWDMWRRTRRLDIRKETGVFWFGNDSKDFLGRLGAYAYALIPLLIGILVPYLFAESQGLGIIVFNKVISFNSVFGSQPLSHMISSEKIDILASLLFLPFVGMFILASLVTLQLIRIIHKQRRIFRL